MTTINDYEYIDEELPEITIEEYISYNDFDYKSGEKTGINVHSEDEIITLIIALLQSMKDSSNVNINQKANEYLNLHKNIIKSETFSLPQSFIPSVMMERVEVENTVNDFVDKYDEIKKVNNYKIRYEQLDKLFYNFKNIETTKNLPSYNFEHESHEVQLNETNGDNVRLLAKDGVNSKVQQLKINKGISVYDEQFNKLTLVDRIKSEYKPVTEINLINENNIENVITNYSDKVWTEVLELQNNLTDTYSLWKQFMEHSINIHDTNNDKWLELVQHLEKIKDKETEFTFKPVSKYIPTPVESINDYVYQFYLINKGIVEKIIPNVKILQDNLLKLYYDYVQTIPPLSDYNSKLPKSLFELLVTIYNNPEDIETNIDFLKVYLLREKLDNLQNWINKVNKWDMDESLSLLNKEISRIERTKQSVFDEKHTPINTLKSEIDSIKKGEVLVFEGLDNFQAATDNLFIDDDNIEIENINEDEINIQIFEDRIPVDISNIDDSQKELHEITLRMMNTLQKFSGIQMNISEIYDKIPYKARISKINMIKDKLPEYSNDILLKLTNVTTLQLDTLIESTIKPENKSNVKKAFEEVNKIFTEEIFDYISTFICIWIMDIQQNVLNNTLDFKIWDGAVNCIDAWSPYGMPMDGMKLKKEGVATYLLCIIDTLKNTEGSLWNVHTKNISKEEYVKKFISLFENEFKDNAERLQKEFKSFNKDNLNINLTSKADEVKARIIETVKDKDKKRYLNDYMNFLKNLPSVLLQSSIAKKIHIGCCLQHLDEKYRSDYDWSILVRPAYRIKKLYSSQRYGIEPRPALATSLKIKEEQQKYDYSDATNYINYNIEESQNVKELIEGLKDLIPINEFNNIKQNIITAENLTIENLDIYYKTIQNKTISINDTKLLSLQDMMQLYRKIIEIQYSIMKDNKNMNFTKEWNETTNTCLRDYITNITGYYNEVEESKVKELMKYIISRQLCFPSKPEIAVNKTLTSNRILEFKNYLISVNNSMLEWITIKQFNKTTNFNDYINNAREQENLEKLNIVDKMNPEERNIYIQAKKLGIVELGEYMEGFKNINEDIYNDEYFEQAGEEEYYPIHGENNDDTNIDKFYDEQY